MAVFLLFVSGCGSTHKTEDNSTTVSAKTIPSTEPSSQPVMTATMTPRPTIVPTPVATPKPTPKSTPTSVPLPNLIPPTTPTPTPIVTPKPTPTSTPLPSITPTITPKPSVNPTIKPTVVPPQGNEDKIVINKGTKVTIDVLANDSDSDGTLNEDSITIVSMPLHGMVEIVDGKIVYTPDEAYTGEDSFSYRVQDNDGLDTEEVMVYVTVKGQTPSMPNKKPLAQAQTLKTPEDTNLSIVLVGSDEDNDTLSYSVVSQPTHGTLSGTAPNLVYTPYANYNGNDSFMFKVNDGTVDSVEASVSIVVTPVNNAPIAVDDNTTTQEKKPVSIQPLLNDYDVDGNMSKLRVISITKPQFGEILLDHNNVYYSPKSKNATLDSLTYTISDEYNATSTATITIRIFSKNDAPIALNQTIETNEEQAISFELNGTDPDGDAINYTRVYTQYVPEHGTISGNAPKLIYTPNANYTGDDYVVFKVDDGKLESSIAVVTIIVHPLNDPPIAIAGEDLTIKRGDTVVLDGSKSYDVDGNITSYEWKEGSEVLSTDENFSKVFYDEGIHKLTLTVTDDKNATDSDEKIITINSCCDGCVYPDPTQTNPYK